MCDAVFDSTPLRVAGRIKGLPFGNGTFQHHTISIDELTGNDQPKISMKPCAYGSFYSRSIHGSAERQQTQAVPCG